MKRVIFTTYDNINLNVQNKGFSASEIEHTQKSDNAKQMLVDEYFDRLVQNKKDYTKSIGVDFKFFHNTMKDFNVEGELEFTKANLYKHHLMAALAEEYDEVMYVDMDVLFNTDLNVFEEHDLSKGIHVKDQDSHVTRKNKEEIGKLSEVGLRSPLLKYHITKDLLDGQDNHVINTGIMIGRSNHIKQIRFIERMQEAIDKIEKIKEDWSVLSDLYYPNNESIFSYILEKYNVPYVILKDEWHQIHDQSGKIYPGNSYCMHFINKQFARFFKDKTYGIFSIHIDIEDENLDNPKSYPDNEMNKSKIAQVQFRKYKDRLLENHKEYAKAVGAEYALFERDGEYEKFKKKFSTLSEYDIVNLYKIYLLDKLSKKYDFILYIDMDVWFSDHKNIFESLPCNYAIGCQYDHPEWLGIENSKFYFYRYQKDFRNPEAKYWNAHALLSEEGLNPSNRVFNTGVVLASRYGMERLDYFSDIDDVLNTMKELKEDSMYPENIQASFGYDNETIFSYKVEKNKVNTHRLSDNWHCKHYYDVKESMEEGTRARKAAKIRFNSRVKKDKATIVHFISKNFGLVFDNN